MLPKPAQIGLTKTKAGRYVVRPIRADQHGDIATPLPIASRQREPAAGPEFGAGGTLLFFPVVRI
jgi:hypothetical protein